MDISSYGAVEAGVNRANKQEKFGQKFTLLSNIFNLPLYRNPVQYSKEHSFKAAGQHILSPIISAVKVTLYVLRLIIDIVLLRSRVSKDLEIIFKNVIRIIPILGPYFSEFFAACIYKKIAAPQAPVTQPKDSPPPHVRFAEKAVTLIGDQLVIHQYNSRYGGKIIQTLSGDPNQELLDILIQPDPNSNFSTRVPNLVYLFQNNKKLFSSFLAFLFTAKIDGSIPIFQLNSFTFQYILKLVHTHNLEIDWNARHPKSNKLLFDHHFDPFVVQETVDDGSYKKGIPTDRIVYFDAVENKFPWKLINSLWNFKCNPYSFLEHLAHAVMTDTTQDADFDELDESALTFIYTTAHYYNRQKTLSICHRRNLH